MANVYSDTLGTFNGEGESTGDFTFTEAVEPGFIYVVRCLIVWFQRVVSTDQMFVTVNGEGPGGLIIYDSVPILTNQTTTVLDVRIALTTAESNLSVSIDSPAGFNNTVYAGGYRLSLP